MSNGGIYEGPGGQQLYGNGREVDPSPSIDHEPVETSKPADLLCNHEHCYSHETVKGLLAAREAAHISEVERLNTERASNMRLRSDVAAAQKKSAEDLDYAKEQEKERKTAESKLSQLQLAVRNVYFAGIWSCDRPVDEARLWTELRDAAGFKPGESTAILNGGQS